MYGALRRCRHELDGRWQGRGGGRRARLRAAIREREAPTVQTSGQKHLSSTLTHKKDIGDRDNNVGVTKTQILKSKHKRMKKIQFKRIEMNQL